MGESSVCVCALGKQTAEDDQAFDELLPELVSGDGRLFSFGRGLASGTRNPEATWNALVHRHRRMIHPIRLQEFENICKFPILVNAPNESVH